MYLQSRLKNALLGLFVSGAVASALAALAVGCATSSPVDLSDDDGPGAPTVDAGSHLKPGSGTSDAAGSADVDSGDPDVTEDPDAGTTPPKDAGTTPKDAGTPPVDSGPVDSGTGAATPPLAGELLITEVMYDTTTPEPASEWLELHSTASVGRKLTGLTLKDGADRTHVIGPGMIIAPGAYVILARDKAGAIAAMVPAAAIVYEYGAGLADNAGILLANGASGGISVLNGSTVLVSAPYGGWFTQAGGSSLQLGVLSAPASTSKASWCLSATAWTTDSGNGTPGVANDCP